VRRYDAVVLAAILVIAGAAWLYLLSGPAMGGMSWSWKEWLLLFIMWAVMMVAMMLPSAAPVILLFSRTATTRSAAAFFTIGYLLVWWGFSAVAASAQLGLHSVAMTLNPIAGAAILIAAGVYQWLPVKQVCLQHCRSPLGFLMSSWRDGRRGALIMGMTHGAFCVGCCWMLMALLFVTGVMNLAWVAALAGIVLVEKVFPGGPFIARFAGVVLVAAGVAQLL